MLHTAASWAIQAAYQAALSRAAPLFTRPVTLLTLCTAALRHSGNVAAQAAVCAPQLPRSREAFACIQAPAGPAAGQQGGAARRDRSVQAWRLPALLLDAAAEAEARPQEAGPSSMAARASRLALRSSTVRRTRSRQSTRFRACGALLPRPARAPQDTDAQVLAGNSSDDDREDDDL